MLLLLYVRAGCWDLEPAINVVMTLEPAWEVLSLGLGAAGDSARAFPLPPRQVMENFFLSTLLLDRNKPNLSQSSSSRSEGKHCGTSHGEKGRDHRDRHMAPNPVRTFYRTRDIPEEISKQPPRKPKFAKKEERVPQEELCTNGLADI